MKQIIITVLVIAAIITGAVLLSNRKSDTVNTEQSAQTSNNVYGNLDGIVTVTEYGDFQCPSCGQFYPITKQVKEQLKDKVKFEFKNFPLSQIHPNAIAAHRAAQAAANQGKFWEMHDLIYEGQNQWSSVTSPNSIFEQYASQIGLDLEKYKVDVSASDTLAIINADVAKGKELKISGTPTYLIDGEIVPDLSQISTVDSFVAFIQSKIDAKTNKQAPEESSTKDNSDSGQTPTITPSTEQ